MSEIVGHQRSLAYIAALLDQGNIPHALLFTGPAGVGKHTTALAMAMALNCLSAPSPSIHAQRHASKPDRDDLAPQTTIDACGACRSCRKIQASQHPDIIDVHPKKSVIQISQVRDLLYQLALKPYEGRTRVVIMADAHAMNAEASNALLKMLEEPPADNLFILTTPQKSDLLPTIVSRCHPVGFGLLTSSEIAQLLVKDHQIASEHAEAVAMLAEGSIANALDMRRKNWLARRQWLIAELERLQNRPVNALLALSERLAGQKEALDGLLGICQTWFRDLLVYNLMPDNIINKDMRNRIQHASEKTSRATLIKQLDAIAVAQAHMRANANVRLTLDMMVLRLAGP